MPFFVILSSFICTSLQISLITVILVWHIALFHTVSPYVVAFYGLGGNHNSLSPYTLVEYVITGSTAIFDSSLKTLWAKPPLFSNVEITLPTARVAARL